MTKMLIDRSTVEQALEALQAAANFFANIDLHESFNPPTANFGSQVEELLIAAEPTLRAALAEPVQEPVASAGLGPLPEPAQPAEPEGYMPGCLWPLPAAPDYYTAEQMREYALRALAKPVQDERTTIADLRCAKWLDPECADKGACQSLKFKRSAEPVQAKSDHETRAEIAEQQVVQLAEERDHYRNLWLKAKQAEPVQEPVQEPVADRAAFERHAERLGYSVDPDTREGREGGYWSSHTQLMWLTWQAALAEPVQEPVAQAMQDAVVYGMGIFHGGKRIDPDSIYKKAETVHEPVAFKDAPERIWLQACDDDHCEVPFHEHDEITWWTEQQNPLDVQYVRADLAAPPQRKPLTEEEILSVLRLAPPEPSLWPHLKDEAVVGDVQKAVLAIARAIERAHGIGEQQ